MRSGPVAAIVIASAFTIGLLAAGCGEREFSATEFVAAANEQGAELALGDQITTNGEGEDVYEVESAPVGKSNPQLESEHGGGTIVVADDAGSAGEEFERCEQAADLTCFRAANVVLRFEEMDGADRARISGAVSALASDG